MKGTFCRSYSALPLSNSVSVSFTAYWKLCYTQRESAVLPLPCLFALHAEQPASLHPDSITCKGLIFKSWDVPRQAVAQAKQAVLKTRPCLVRSLRTSCCSVRGRRSTMGPPARRSPTLIPRGSLAPSTSTQVSRIVTSKKIKRVYCKVKVGRTDQQISDMPFSCPESVEASSCGCENVQKLVRISGQGELRFSHRPCLGKFRQSHLDPRTQGLRTRTGSRPLLMPHL
jgi:hypothetical protein